MKNVVLNLPNNAVSVEEALWRKLYVGKIEGVIYKCQELEGGCAQWYALGNSGGLHGNECANLIAALKWGLVEGMVIAELDGLAELKAYLAANT